MLSGARIGIGAGSAQPTLAAPVGAHIAEGLAALVGHAEVELLHVGVLPQGGGLAIHHHATRFQDVAVTQNFSQKEDRK